MAKRTPRVVVKLSTKVKGIGRPLNRILASLSTVDFARLRPHLEKIDLAYKQPLYDADVPIKFVYFLDTGVASLVNVMRNGDAAEVGTIGNEGIVGLPVMFGDTVAPTSVYMQVRGAGHRISAPVFWKEMERSLSLRLLVLRYIHVFFNQVAQSAACAHFHTLDKRCCRWLLMTCDRMQEDDFPLTQEFLAMMLGVRRAGVTQAAGKLQRDGLIHYGRGRVRIMDRNGLVKRACECYGIGKRDFDRLLGSLPPMAAAG